MPVVVSMSLELQMASLRAATYLGRSRKSDGTVPLFTSFKGLPWALDAPQDEALPELVDAPSQPGQDPEDRGVNAPRRTKLTREVLEKYGYMPRCQGCTHVRLGGNYRPAH